MALAGHLGDGATAAQGWNDPDAGVRALALGALRRTGGLSEEVLQAALADPAAVVRRRACEEVATRGAAATPGAVRQVEARLGDRDPTVVEAACFSLGEVLGSGSQPGQLDRATALQALAGVATAHRDPLCREAAVAALGAIGDPLGLPAILAATRDKAPVRRRAVLALAPFDGEAVEEALARALTDRDWQVRQAAEDMSAT